MIEIFAVDTEIPVTKSMYIDLLHSISKLGQENIRKYSYDNDKKRSLYASSLVRYLACSKLNMKNSDIFTKKNSYGKPYFVGIVSYYFNISHSDNLVLCAWGNKEVGIDVEGRKIFNINVAKSFFCNSEYLTIINSSKNEQNELFWTMWVLKESYVKFKGKGLYMPLNSFEIHINNDDIEVIDLENEDKPTFHCFNFNGNFKVAICSEDQEFVNDIKYISINTICKKLCE